MAASQPKKTGLEGCLAALARGMMLRFAVTLGVIVAFGVMLLIGVPTLTVITGDGTSAFLISFICALMLVLVAGVGSVFVWRGRVNKRLDNAFAAYGLEASSHMISGRKFSGEFNGVAVQAYLQRGPLLNIVMPAPFQTQAVIGTGTSIGRAINQAVDRKPLDLREPGYESAIAFSADPVWFDRVLHDKQVAHGVQRFMQPTFAQLRQVHFNPDELLFRIHRIHFNQITEESIGQWLRMMAHVRQAALKLPVATEMREPSKVVQNLRTGRFSNPWVLWGIVLGIVGIGVVCPALFVVLLLASGAM